MLLFNGKTSIVTDQMTSYLSECLPGHQPCVRGADTSISTYSTANFLTVWFSLQNTFLTA